MALNTQTPKEYYEGDNKGYYQFIKLADIVNNFIVSQVGDDKIIKSAKRAEVLFHAQRGIQELNYDTLNNVRTQEIDLPPSLSMALPHDYVDFVKVCFVDNAGVEYYIKEASLTSEPSAVLQDDEYNYLFDDQGEILLAAESETRKRFKDGTRDEAVNTDSNINYLEEGYGYNVDYGKRYGIEPEHATKNGTFTINKKNGTINFSSDLKDKLISLKYISDGLNKDGSIEVHKFAEEAIYKCMAHGIITAKSNVPEYQINRVKKEKRAAIRNAKLRLAKIDIKDILQTMRNKSKQIKH